MDFIEGFVNGQHPIEQVEGRSGVYTKVFKGKEGVGQGKSKF